MHLLSNHVTPVPNSVYCVTFAVLYVFRHPFIPVRKPGIFILMYEILNVLLDSVLLLN